MATTVTASLSPATPNRRSIPPTRVLIALNGSGTGSEAVTYSPSFDNTPKAMIVSPEGTDAADFTLASESKTGCTLTVTACTEYASKSVEVVLVAHERL